MRNAKKTFTHQERKEIMQTLVDVYKAKGLQKTELKGATREGGDPIYGYPYSPELFEISDITGSKVRYYVTLPGGRKAHPTELFPGMTDSKVESILREAEAKTKNEAILEEENQAAVEYLTADNVSEANKKFAQVYSRGISSVSDEIKKSILLTNQNSQFVRVSSIGRLKAAISRGFTNVQWKGVNSSWADKALTQTGEITIAD